PRMALGSRLKAQRSRLEAQQGFTFVELLIAATMMSVLFVGLGTHLRGGIAIWRRATTTTETLQRQRVALDRLERDLAHTILYDLRPAAYGPEDGKLPPLQFTSSALAWVTLSLDAQQLPAVRFVMYECGEVEGTPGLWRTSRSIRDARARREARPERVLPECEGLSFQYAYLPADASMPLEWHDLWLEPERSVPSLVRVSVQVPHLFEQTQQPVFFLAHLRCQYFPL
ncbi:MAG: prepilin-type N-terminal cleavage/methylation domain-containing protein, partial [Actinomycetota bacterium]